MGDYSKIPQRLKDCPSWVVAKLVADPKKQGKLKKIPFNPVTKDWDDWNNPDKVSTFEEATSYCDAHPPKGKVLQDGDYVLGFVFHKEQPLMGLDLDNVLKEDGSWKDEAFQFFDKYKGCYMERTPSGNGLRLFVEKATKSDLKKLTGQDLGDGASVELFVGSGFCTVTGNRVGKDSEIRSEDPAKLWAWCKSLNKSNGSVEAKGRNNSLASYAGSLVNRRLSAEEIKILVRAKNKEFSEPLDEREIAQTIDRFIDSKATKEELDPDSWREGCKSFGQLSPVPPKFLIEGLMPEGSLTAISAPSFNCKTWFTLMTAWAVSRGEDIWGFEVREAVPVIYHVPEMNEADIRWRMALLGMHDTENFLVRPMEAGVWTLDDPRMLRSSEGRAVFLDTQGFFNPSDDAKDYSQSIKFAKLVFNLLNVGCRGVGALFHMAKQPVTEWTLENSIIGSAGYGAMLRSCLRMKNINPDLNDKDVRLYVQGMKNPGLKPFQLVGLPLELDVAPGDSPYIKDLAPKAGRKTSWTEEKDKALQSLWNVSSEEAAEKLSGMFKDFKPAASSVRQRRTFLKQQDLKSEQRQKEEQKEAF